MSEGALFKPEKDYSKDADKIIPEAEQLAKVNLTPCHQEPLKLTRVSQMFKARSIGSSASKSKPDK